MMTHSFPKIDCVTQNGTLEPHAEMKHVQYDRGNCNQEKEIMLKLSAQFPLARICHTTVQNKNIQRSVRIPGFDYQYSRYDITSSTFQNLKMSISFNVDVQY